MKITTKLLTQVFAVLLSLTLAACGGGGASPSGTGGESPAGDKQSGSLPAEEENGGGEESGSLPEEKESEDSEAADWLVGLENANPIGKSGVATFENRYGEDKENVTITVDEVIRGDEAFARIEKEMEKSAFSPQPPEDETDEYLIAKITFTLNSYEDAGSKEPQSFYATDSTGERYPALLPSMFFIAAEDEENDFVRLTSQTVSVGETITGYEVFLVKKSEERPLVAYRNFRQDNSDGLWFQLY